LVGVGGDGTAAELVNRTSPGVPLTLLPTGNRNLLAQHLGISGDPEQLVRTIAAGRLGQWDAGRAGAGRAGGRIFLLMASCGLDAEVVRVLHGERRGHMTSRHYLKPLWSALRSYQYPPMRVYCDENVEAESVEPDYRLSWVSLFNLSCYGWQRQFAPQADGQDGELDVCGFRRGSRFRGFGYLAAICLRRHTRLPDWTTRRVRRVRIESDAAVPYQLDGDAGGFLPLEIEVLPKRLTLLTPG
jgi:diacylglycerol kinase family enzyme